MNPLAKTLVHALAATGLAGAAITPAFAGTEARGPIDRMIISVPVADLDLGTAAGQRTLDKRVEKAVRSVCRKTNFQTGTRIMDQEARNCLAQARADAKQQIAALTNGEARGG
ncbi:UrcA family protein [Erythrobacter colymbi]|uniref:UrcA family protein n=1 Tax=Erythrobacter colymbi TaxID=1161202 RepID=UPI000A36F192|nr:UrcA family protein [Erythrobacter colymbi]